MALEHRGKNQRDELSKWHSFFLVAFHFLFTMYSNLACVTWRSNSSCICIHCFFFFIPRWRFVLQTEILGKYIHRFDDQNSLTSKCIENWALFERVTHSQRSALSVCPQGCAQRKALESQLFFAPTYIRENISFSSNLRSGSIFVSLWTLHSRGHGETKREPDTNLLRNVCRPLFWLIDICRISQPTLLPLLVFLVCKFFTREKNADWLT